MKSVAEGGNPPEFIWFGLLYPGILTVRARAEGMLEEYSRPLHLLDEAFVPAVWHQRHPVSHKWWEHESWMALWDRRPGGAPGCVVNLLSWGKVAL